jgi:amino acid adenylation domain-containing protein
VPLSSGQQRLWFLDQWQSGNPAYNLPTIIPLPSPVEVLFVQRALDVMMHRHASLRTKFRMAGDVPVQDVMPLARAPFLCVNSGDFETPSELARKIRDEIRTSFDLQCGPLFRAVLFRREPESLLVLTVHHIVADGWSLGVLYQEFGALYKAACAGRRAAIEELPIQYTDFAAWQRRRLEGEAMREQVGYWRQRLAGAPTLELPTTYPRRPSPSYCGALHEFLLPAEIVIKLKLMAQREHATLYMVLLSVFIALLHRYTGQSDIVVGAPVAGRSRPETERLVGFFVNTLALRVNTSEKPSFQELLARVRKTLLEALDHQDVPFERLVQELQLDRDLSRNPLFQVTFQLFTGPGRETAAETSSGGPISIDKGTAVFDLAFNLWESPRGIEGRIEYSTDLFDEGFAGRMAQHYITMVQSVAHRQDESIDALELLTPEEKHQILVEWNQTRTEPANRLCAHEMFEHHALTHPERPAVTYQGRLVHYGALNLWADGIARHLRRLGIETSDAVGVCLPRSPELMAAMLGVMKAGGAYVPIDAALPAHRVSLTLRDCGARAAITCRSLEASVSGHTSRTLLIEDCEHRREASAASRSQPGSLAYILYTSGSTGSPKGVEVEHGALSNLIDWHVRAYDVRPEDRATQMASISFDASIWEILPYLASGACVYIVDDDTRLDPVRLLECIKEKGINISFVPTPLAESLLQMELPPGLKLRTVLTGGDRLRHVPTRSLPFQFVNHYGPTENAVVATSAIMDARSAIPPAIGRPISNNFIYILDDNLQPVPIGVPGQICIGGKSLARGYRNRPQLTAETFVPNPFDRAGSTRLYKTGDRARFREDGEIEFLGRNDRQVKIRGFRIEPGEIEAALVAYPGIVEAHVGTLDDPIRGGQLCAYYVTNLPVIKQQLREHLTSHLPDYMVPSSFCEVQAIPLTPNFKVDEPGLRAHLQERVEKEDGEPRNTVETVLAGLWSEVLHIERIGVHEDFFTDCGGHSLLAVSLASRIREALQVDLTLRSLFEAPTIRQFADRLLEDPRDGARIQTVAALLLQFLETTEAEEALARGEEAAL